MYSDQIWLKQGSAHSVLAFDTRVNDIAAAAAALKAAGWRQIVERRSFLGTLSEAWECPRLDNEAEVPSPGFWGPVTHPWATVLEWVGPLSLEGYEADKEARWNHIGTPFRFEKGWRDEARIKAGHEAIAPYVRTR